MLLSIIIPAYNVESYIAACLDSIFFDLRYKHLIEVVITDDGSSDNTKEIVFRFSQIHNNIIICSQPNSGVSSARNTAIEKSSGKFILFLDADDTIEHGTLNQLLNNLEKVESDLLILGYKKINNNNVVLYQTNFTELPKTEIFDLHHYYVSSGENNQLADINRCWGMIYKTDIVKQLAVPFTVGAPYLEDAGFLAKYFCLMKSYSFSNIVLCRRLMRDGSAVNSNLFSSEKAIVGFRKIIDDLEFFKNRIDFPLNVKNDRVNHMNQTLIKFLTLQIISAMDSKSMKLVRETISISQKQNVKYNWRGVRYPFNFWGWTYNISIYLFILVFYVQVRLRFVISKML